MDGNQRSEGDRRREAHRRVLAVVSAAVAAVAAAAAASVEPQQRAGEHRGRGNPGDVELEVALLVGDRGGLVRAARELDLGERGVAWGS